MKKGTVVAVVYLYCVKQKPWLKSFTYLSVKKLTNIVNL